MPCIWILITQQSCRSSLAELMARTSLDLELDLQASRTRQRQLNEEICVLRELRQRLEDAQLRGQTDLPHWVLRDERFRNLLKEAERQVSSHEVALNLFRNISFQNFLMVRTSLKNSIVYLFIIIMEIQIICVASVFLKLPQWKWLHWLLPNCVFVWRQLLENVTFFRYFMAGTVAVSLIKEILLIWYFAF